MCGFVEQPRVGRFWSCPSALLLSRYSLLPLLRGPTGRFAGRTYDGYTDSQET